MCEREIRIRIRTCTNTLTHTHTRTNTHSHTHAHTLSLLFEKHWSVATACLEIVKLNTAIAVQRALERKRLLGLLGVEHNAPPLHNKHVAKVLVCNRLAGAVWASKVGQQRRNVKRLHCHSPLLLGDSGQKP